MKDQAREEGANEVHNSQRLSNEKRSAKDGSARQEAEQDTSYGCPSQRAPSQTRWSAREPSSDRRNIAYDDRDTRRDDSRERSRDPRQGRGDYRDIPRDNYSREYSEPRSGDDRMGYSRERPQGSYNDRKRDEESAPPRKRSRNRQPQGRYEQQRAEERYRREPQQNSAPRPTREQGEANNAGCGGGRGYPARNQSRSETFAKDVQPNDARPSGTARQERNACFASATVNNAALDREEDIGRDSPRDGLSDGTDFPSDREYYSSEDDVPAGNGH